MNSTVRTTEPKTLARGANIVLTALTYLLAAVFVYTSYTKFSGSTASVQTFDDIGAGQWLRYSTAGLELAGAIGLLIPRLTGLAAACLTALLVGAVLSQLIFVTDANITTPAVLMVITGLLAWFRRDRIVALFTRGSRPAAGMSR
jgi:putative oxidoreductase